MRLSRALQEKLMDVRLRDKLLAEGKLTKEEVKKFLDGTADEANNATYTDIFSNSYLNRKARYMRAFFMPFIFGRLAQSPHYQSLFNFRLLELFTTKLK
jgi:hypothetical protein